MGAERVRRNRWFSSRRIREVRAVTTRRRPESSFSPELGERAGILEAGKEGK